MINYRFSTSLGDSAVLEAAKRGNLDKIRKLLTPENVNCRDTAGRNSTPLHLAGDDDFLNKLFLKIKNVIIFVSTIVLFFTAGYNNYEVAEFLILNGADVNAQDKGGLIPLHNASSYGVRK